MRSLPPVFVWMALLICACAQHQTREASFPISPLDAEISIFNDAFRTGDTALLDSMTTGSYRHTNGSAQPLNKDSWLNYLAERRSAMDRGEIVIHEYTMKDLQTVFYDDAALITCEIIVNSSQTGALHLQAYRTMQLWVVDAGRWKRAAYQDARIR